MAAKTRDEIKQSLLGLETVAKERKNQEVSDKWVNKSSYADSIAKLVFDTKPKKENAKKS